MQVTRRDFLKASAAVAAALGLRVTGPGARSEALALERVDGGVPVVWLQAQGCSGCSVSLLNSIRDQSIGGLLLNALDLEFHSTVMAAAGNLAVAAAERAYRRGGYVLAVEGAIPTAANGEYCYLWSGLTALKGVERFARRAAFIIGVGSCACYGGMVAAAPNPTEAQGLDRDYFGKRVIKIPGCPTHPDWVVGTIAHLIANGEAPNLDRNGRPLEFFSERIHEEWCPRYATSDEGDRDSMLGGTRCLRDLGCKGPRTRADCPQRLWNAGGPGQGGVNWCVGAGTPCFGCTEPDFPDAMSPFFEFPTAGA
jgi:hydrogenase small subunit